MPDDDLKKQLREESVSETTKPVKAVREYCLNSCMYSVGEVRHCPTKECPLWAFRFGRNPYQGSKIAEFGHNSGRFKKGEVDPTDGAVIDLTPLFAPESDLGEEI